MKWTEFRQWLLALACGSAMQQGLMRPWAMAAVRGWSTGNESNAVEDAFDQIRTLDGGDHFHRAAAIVALEYVYQENAFQ
jgi:hypothetical protein